MKVKNLLEAIINEYDKSSIEAEIDDKVDDVDDPIEDYINKHGGERIGSGAFAVVYDKPRGVHTVIKTGISRIKFGELYDGYLSFVMRLMNDPRARDNPFLPQIFSVKFKSISNMDKELFRFFIEMEKLEEIIDDDMEKQYYTVRDMLNDLEENPLSKFSQIARMFSDLINLDEEDLVKYIINEHGVVSLPIIWKILTRLLFHGERYDFSNSNMKVTSKQLLEAVSLLKKYQRGGLDLHIENIMIRRSPYGLQLVFTDPYAG